MGLHRINLRTRLLVLTTLTVVTGLLAMFFTGLDAVKRSAVSQALEKQEVSLHILINALVEGGATLEVEYGPDEAVEAIHATNLPRIAGHDLIDKVGTISGETATLFAWESSKKDFVRKTTNIKKADGSRAVGTVLGEASSAYAPMIEGHRFRGEAVILGIPYYTLYQPILGPEGTAIGIAYVGVTKEAVTEQVSAVRLKLLVMSLVVIVLATGAGFLALRQTLAPLTALIGVTDRLLQGEIDAAVPYVDRSDEIGSLGKALETWRTALIEARTFEREKAEAEAEANKVRRQSQQEGASVIEGKVSSLIGGLNTSASSIDNVAKSVKDTSEVLRSRSARMEEAAKRASGSVEAAAVAAEELHLSVREIAEQMMATDGLVKTVNARAGESETQVSGLETAADEIGTIVQLISDIAEQTNLLALNATIEAARAGEAGRGFAVVASEVKSLAGQTARATAEISDKIKTIQERTDTTADSISRITQTVDSLRSMTATVSSAVEEQTAAIKSIADGIRSASEATSDVSDDAVALASKAEDGEQSAEDAAQQARQLTSVAQELDEQVRAIIDTLRAA